MNTLTLTVQVTIAGAAAGTVRDDLLIDADSGELDLAMKNLLREHLRGHKLELDWRIVSARCDVPEVTA